MNRLLLLSSSFLAFCLTAFADDTRPIRVALFDDEGAFGKGVPNVTKQLSAAKEVTLTVLKGPEFAAGVLKDYDVVIFTGGSGSKQAATLGDAGRKQVRDFVEKGGGYIGICGGAYLACAGFSWGLGVLDAKTVSSKWRRGKGPVQIEVTPAGQQVTGTPAKQTEIRYANGPIIQPAGLAEVPDYEPLALFRSELAENDTPKGVMVDSPAWASGTFGKGRVLISSPHPEQTEGMEGWIVRAVRWAAGR
jgi:putative intracellular protease/amidase